MIGKQPFLKSGQAAHAHSNHIHYIYCYLICTCLCLNDTILTVGLFLIYDKCLSHSVYLLSTFSRGLSFKNS